MINLKITLISYCQNFCADLEKGLAHNIAYTSDDRKTMKKSWQGRGRGASATLLTDFSKAFDCLPHNLLIAKLHCKGIKKGSLNFLFSYLKNRKQRVRLNNTYNEWIGILFGVPQGSILGPLLYNMFLCDLFLFLHDILVANNADDSTPYCIGLKILDVLIKLENAAETLLQWFKDNRMKANPDMYHLLINITKESFQIKIGNETVAGG